MNYLTIRRLQLQSFFSVRAASSAMGSIASLSRSKPSSGTGQRCCCARISSCGQVAGMFDSHPGLVALIRRPALYSSFPGTPSHPGFRDPLKELQVLLDCPAFPLRLRHSLLLRRLGGWVTVRRGRGRRTGTSDVWLDVAGGLWGLWSSRHSGLVDDAGLMTGRKEDCSLDLQRLAESGCCLPTKG